MKPSTPALREPGGVFTVDPSEKASLLGSRFERAHPSEFRIAVLLRRHLDLAMCRGVDPLGQHPIFLKQVADIIAPKLSTIFRQLIRLGSFPEYWQSANVTAIPMGVPSIDKENNLPKSITHILPKVYQKLVSHKLSIFREKCGFLPDAQFSY